MSDDDILDPTALSQDALGEIALAAEKYRAANTVLMKLINFGASKAEGTLKILPKETQAKIDDLVVMGLTQAYHTANWSQSAKDGSSLDKLLKRVAGERAHRQAATVSGALGGFAGVASTTAEIPVSVGLILRSVQNIAKEYGEDISTEDVRLECIKVFGSGGPLMSDDGVDVGFIGAKVTLTGQAVQNIIQVVAARFGVVMGQKIAAQAVPVLGAVTGAGINYSFMQYYQQMAHVRFQLRKLVRNNDPVLVEKEFRILALK